MFPLVTELSLSLPKFSRFLKKIFGGRGCDTPHTPPVATPLPTTTTGTSHKHITHHTLFHITVALYTSLSKNPTYQYKYIAHHRPRE